MSTKCKAGIVQRVERDAPIGLDARQHRNRGREPIKRQRRVARPGVDRVPLGADGIVIGDAQEAVICPYRPALGGGPADEAGDSGVEKRAEDRAVR